jgi:hypothetical protein
VSTVFWLRWLLEAGIKPKVPKRRPRAQAVVGQHGAAPPVLD